MPKTSRTWGVRLTAAAERDLGEITAWTARRFGHRQARAYSAIIRRAVRTLSGGPAAMGVRQRLDFGRGLYSLHAARGGRHARHLIVFRLNRSRSVVVVLRIPHDAMDVARHVAPEETDEGASQ